MTRTTRLLLVNFLMAGLVVAVGAAPAAAVDQAIDGTGVVHAGFYTEFGAGGVSGAGDDLGDHAAATGHRVSLAGYFMDVYSTPAPGSEIPGNFNNVIVQFNEAWAGQATPFINLQVGTATSAQIKAGSHDAKIDQWAGYLKRWLEGENLNGTNVSKTGRSIIVAPLPEMNWTGGATYQCQPADFPGAYERIVDRVESALGPATKEGVRWAFAPNNATGAGACAAPLADYYPNPAKVDFTAFSGYNFHGFTGPNEAVSSVMGGIVGSLKTIAPTKPIIVAQTASCSTNPTRAQWITDMFDLLKADKYVNGFVWFNQNKECDWRIWDGTTANASWDSNLDGATHQHPISNWFVAGTTLVVNVADTPDPCPVGKTCDSVSLIDGTGPNFNNYHRPTQLSPKNVFIYGNPGDFPLMGDWDCNGTDTPGQYRQSDGFVYLTDVNAASVASRQFFLGNPGDFPIVGDFNGNGCDTVSIYRPSTQQFFIANKLANNNEGIVADFPGYVFGDPGDKAFSGDLDGDGADEVALHRESTGFVFYRFTLDTGAATAQFFFGDPGDIIEAGDWNGDGTDTVGVYRPSSGTVFLKLANAQGNADFSFTVGFGMIGFGTAPRIP